MQTVKEKITQVVLAQPEDATYEEIVRELAFERMIERGLNDVRSGRVISNEDMAIGFAHGKAEVDQGSRAMADRYS